MWNGRLIAAIIGILILPILMLENASSREIQLPCRVDEAITQIEPDINPNIKALDGNPLSGEESKITWNLRDQTLNDDMYLVVAMSELVRFKGEGFVALPPRSRAPRSIKGLEDRTRVVIPVSGHLSNINGVFDVTFYEPGPQVLYWQIVRLPKSETSICKQVTVAHGSLEINVQPGRPQLVTQNRFTEGSPKNIQESDTGRYLLYDYGDRYEVFDAATGDVLVSHAGSSPRFSSRGRYVTSFDGSKRLEIVDIIAQKTIFASSTLEQGDFGGVIVAGWLNEDSLLLLGYGRKGAVGVTVPLVDDRNIFSASISCNACQAFGSTSLLLDLDSLTVQASDQDLFQSSLVEVAASPSVIKFWEEQDPNDRGPEPRRPKYLLKFADNAIVDDKLEIPSDANGFGSFTWELSDKITFVFFDVWNGNVKAQREILNNHAAQQKFKDSRALSERQASGRVVRRVVEVGNTRVSPKSYFERAAESIAQFGIELLPNKQPEQFRPAKFTGDDYDKQTESALKIVRKVLAETSASRKPMLLTKKNIPLGGEDRLFTREYGRFGACNRGREVKGWNEDTDVEEPAIISADRLQSAWRAQLPTGVLFIFQQFDYCGTAPDRYGDIISLFIPSDTKLPLRFRRLAASSTSGGETSPVQGLDAARLSLGNALRLAETPTLYVNVADNQYLIIVSRDASKGAVFRLPSMEFLYNLDNVRESLDLHSMSITSNSAAVVQLNNSGHISVNSFSNNSEILFGRYVDDELVLYDRSLAFEATPEGASYVYVRVPGSPGLFTLDQFRSKLEQPGLSRKRLIGEYGDGSPPAGLVPPTLSAHKRDGIYALEAHAFGTLAKLQISVDGRLVKTVPLSGADAKIELPIEKEFHGRWISFFVEDGRQLRSLVRSFLVSRDPYASRLNIVAFGSDKFNRARVQTATVGDLAFAFKDAQRFEAGIKQWIAPAYNGYDAQVLTGTNTDRARLLSEIEKAADATGLRDTLVLFLATHGMNGPSGFSIILPSKETNGPAEEISFGSLSAALHRAHGRVFVFLDACHSAGAIQDVGSEELASTDRNVTIISSSKGRQSSLENAGWGGGAFTNAILGALKRTSFPGSATLDSPLSIEALYAEVRRVVAAQTNGKQTPWLRRSVWVGSQSLN
ncbi:caspase domain-containing protein [Methylobacterium sp. PvR107]|uniref:caspase family protein n=1 Tax=Methylobacterium sp. PvR107 TaxID=2806597 RepID=UPI001AE46442|nr:caspase family protein [Methylobacterium sp. PvR107]MBP1184183.1 hypothetical protein [Methylobacterium sp. PvR107]